MRHVEKILIVDDEPGIRSLFQRHLTRAGFHIITSSNGEDALELLRKKTEISLVVLDILMPQVSGLDVFDAMKKEFPQLKIIISSVYSKDEQEFMIWNADDYFYKNDSISVLAGKINKTIKEEITT